MKKFFGKYHVPLLLLMGIIAFASFMVQVADRLHEHRERYLKAHPEAKWKDGEMITVYQNDRPVLKTPCGSCVFADTESKNVMRIEWHKECGFGTADEVATIPMEIGIIYRAKKEPCKIKK